MIYQMYFYDIEEVGTIDMADIVGTMECNDPEHIYLVNFDGLAFEVNKVGFECFGENLGDIFAELKKMKEADKDIADVIEDFYNYGLLNDEEYEELA